MIEREEVTTQAMVLDILPGDPLRLLTGERLSRNGKSGRLFQQMVPVPDADLFARLTAQVRKRDTIQITVTTEWRDDGYQSWLSDFACLPAASEQTKERAA